MQVIHSIVYELVDGVLQKVGQEFEVKSANICKRITCVSDVANRLNQAKEALSEHEDYVAGLSTVQGLLEADLSLLSDLPRT